MQKATFDLPGLLNLGLENAIKKAEEKTSLEGLGDLVKPLANGLLTSMGIQAIEINPIMFAMGRIVYSGMQRQAAINKARREQDGTGN
jgi:hypothetical protein